MVIDTINEVLNICNCTATVNVTPFGSFSEIPTRAKGVYIIVEGDTVIYVGKGNIKERQRKHWDKAHNNIKPGTQDPDGWKWLRENVEIHPTAWMIYHLSLYKEVEKTAVEALLILRLKPLANDETFKDRRSAHINQI